MGLKQLLPALSCECESQLFTDGYRPGADAVQHPGRESFVGEMARFLLYDRPLTDKEMVITAKQLVNYYGIKLNE
jgi:hypothetical protein